MGYGGHKEKGTSSCIPGHSLLQTALSEELYTSLFVNIYLLLLIYKALQSKVLLFCVSSPCISSVGAEIWLLTSPNLTVYLMGYSDKIETHDFVPNTPPELPTSTDPGAIPPILSTAGKWSSESKHIRNSEFRRISAQPSLVPAPCPHSGGSGLGSPTQPSEPAYFSLVLSQQTRAVSLNKAGPPVPWTLLLCNRALSAKGKLVASAQNPESCREY